jgi:hypothetical protein
LKISQRNYCSISTIKAHKKSIDLMNILSENFLSEKKNVLLNVKIGNDIGKMGS